jgi:hypothetical protein
MLGYPLRTKRLWIEIRFEAIMNAVERVNQSQRVGVGADFLLRPSRFHPDPRDTGIQKVPFH